jgi:hypothetical protein
MQGSSGAAPWWVPLVTAGAALFGALSAQAISAFFGLRQKRYELWFARRGAAYEGLLASAGAYALDPRAEGAYLRFLAALDVATLYASPSVLPLLQGPGSINVPAQRLRTAGSAGDLNALQFVEWFDWMKRLSSSLRDDLRTPAK